MGSRVELFEQIRRDKDREDLSERALAARYRVGRGTVRQALESPIPPPRKRPEGRVAPKLGEYRELIDGWLADDLKAPRKQRHTARRVWKRLVDEHGADVAEATVREHVRKRKREMGLALGQVFVPQTHTPARTAEVDWGQAQVRLAGSQVRVHVFVMRSCFSGAAFSMASPVETQQAFLEGHALAFDWFAGVFESVHRAWIGGGREWGPEWSCSSRSDGTGTERTCQSGRWRRAIGLAAARSGRRWSHRSTATEAA